MRSHRCRSRSLQQYTDRYTRVLSTVCCSFSQPNTRMVKGLLIRDYCIGVFSVRTCDEGLTNSLGQVAGWYSIGPLESGFLYMGDVHSNLAPLGESICSWVRPARDWHQLVWSSCWLFRNSRHTPSPASRVHIQRWHIYAFNLPLISCDLCLRHQ
jgi:hypothetical protein